MMTGIPGWQERAAGMHHLLISWRNRTQRVEGKWGCAVKLQGLLLVTNSLPSAKLCLLMLQPVSKTAPPSGLYVQTHKPFTSKPLDTRQLSHTRIQSGCCYPHKVCATSRQLTIPTWIPLPTIPYKDHHALFLIFLVILAPPPKGGIWTLQVLVYP